MLVRVECSLKQLIVPSYEVIALVKQFTFKSFKGAKTVMGQVANCEKI